MIIMTSQCYPCDVTHVRCFPEHICRTRAPSLFRVRVLDYRRYTCDVILVRCGFLLLSLYCFYISRAQCMLSQLINALFIYDQCNIITLLKIIRKSKGWEFKEAQLLFSENNLITEGVYFG